jgi:hypothetical protein
MNKLVVSILWGAAMFAAFWAFTPDADADPGSDPHVPNWSTGWCPGGGPGIRLGVTALPTNGSAGVWGFCDGEPYDDGTYLHQVPQNLGFTGFGAQVETFCRVGQGSVWSPPAPPGGCDGLQ